MLEAVFRSRVSRATITSGETPILPGPFITELDVRAAIKGSRDPLGIQPLWTRFGRYVVGNLTTVTNSVRDFTTLLLGYYFADQLAGELGPGSEVAVFLKWEQLAAYARFLVNEETGFRGIDRVQKWVSERPHIRISADQECQILSNQKTYGLWGLYTMAARTSGLVDAGHPRLSPQATKFVEETYLPMLAEGTGKDARQLRDLLKQSSKSLPRNDRLFETIARVLKPRLPAREREFYRFHLVEGGMQDATSGKQRHLAKLLESTLTQKDFRWSPKVVEALAKDALPGGSCRRRASHALVAHSSVRVGDGSGVDAVFVSLGSARSAGGSFGDDLARTLGNRSSYGRRTVLRRTACRFRGSGNVTALDRHCRGAFRRSVRGSSGFVIATERSRNVGAGRWGLG